MITPARRPHAFRRLTIAGTMDTRRTESGLQTCPPSVSPIWVKTLLSISDALEKKGQNEKARDYWKQFLPRWPMGLPLSQDS